VNPLQNVPAKTRAIAYWVSYFLSLGLGAVSAGWAIVVANVPSADMPLWLLVVLAIALFLQSQLSQMAGSNVTPDEPEEGSIGKALVNARDQAGALRGIVEQVGAVASHMDSLVKLAKEETPVAAAPVAPPAGTAGPVD
jgi:hypothetical protein